MRLALSVSSSVLMFTAVAASAFGQATVEHALTTGAGSLGASGMSGVGKSIGAVFDQLNRVLQNTGKPASPQPAGVNQATPPSVAQFQEMPARRPLDRELLKLVMPEAKVLIGLQFDRIWFSPIGQTLRAQMGQAQPEFQRLLASADFDPGRDLREILMASPGGEKNPPMLLIARGSFKPSMLASGAASRIRTPQGIEVFTRPKTQESPVQAAALLDPGTLIAGDLDNVQAALGRQGRAAGIAQELAAKAAAISLRYDLWIVADTPVSGLSSQLPGATPAASPQPDLMKSVTRFSGGVGLAPDFELAAELLTRTPADAEGMAAGLRMLGGLLQTQFPSAAGKPGALDNLKLSVQGNAVHISLLVPEQEIRKALQAQMAATTGPGQPAGDSKPSQRSGEIMIQSSPKDMGTVVIRQPQ